MILLDTHTLIWLTEGERRLGAKARQQIDRALQGEQLAVSAISFWEAAMLADRGRIELSLPILAWRQGLLNLGLIEVPVDGEMGAIAGSLEAFHGDPADCMLVATSLVCKARLATADQKILNWPGRLDRLDARQ